MRSTLGKISTIMFLFIFIIASILVLNIAKAQNETFNENQSISGYHVLLENVTTNETVNETSSEESVSGGAPLNNETVENVTLFERNRTFENVTNETVEVVNETFVSNETSNETSQENFTFNETSGQNETVETVDTINETDEVSQEIPLEPIFVVNFVYPVKITRGEIITVIASVKNTGSLAKDVALEWILPDGFEMNSGNMREFCGDLDNDVSCDSEISLKTDVSTILGLNEIKIVVDYEK